MINTTRNPPAPSPLLYIVVSGLGLLAASAMLFSYVLLAPRLIAAGFQDQFFYFVLIVAGLVAAAFLVGGMRAYEAKVTVKHFGIRVQAGGGVAVFILVVGGGLYGVPRNSSFNLTIRPHGPQQPVITVGKIRVNYGDRSDPEFLDSNGEANFKQIPFQFWGTRVKVLPDVEGFQKEYQEVELNSLVIDLPLALEKPEFRLTGRVTPIPSKGEIVRIVVEGEDQTATPDEFGRFQLVVHHKQNERVRLTVYRNDKQVYDNFEVLGEPLMIATRKTR